MTTLLLFAVGTFAGFVNVVAGGGSLLTIPALMLTGLPADIANGSNRVAVLAQSLAGGAAFRQAGRLERRLMAPVLCWTLLGALAGAFLAARLPVAIIRPVLIGSLAATALAILMQPDFGRGATRRPFGPVAAVALFAAGFYGGLVQAGVGFLLIWALAGWLGLALDAANGLKIVVVLVYTVPAVVFFQMQDLIDWVAVVPLCLGTVVGALAGVRFAVRVDPAVMRRLLLVALGAMLLAVVVR